MNVYVRMYGCTYVCIRISDIGSSTWNKTIRDDSPSLTDYQKQLHGEVGIIHKFTKRHDTKTFLCSVQCSKYLCSSQGMNHLQNPVAWGGASLLSHPWACGQPRWLGMAWQIQKTYAQNMFGSQPLHCLIKLLACSWPHSSPKISNAAMAENKLHKVSCDTLVKASTVTSV